MQPPPTSAHTLMIALLVYAASDAFAAQPTILAIESPTGWGTAYVTALSGDGTFAVGYVTASGPTPARAFRWSLASGMQDLGVHIGGTVSWANDVNFDGSVVIGHGNGPGFDYHAMRWTPSTGWLDLGTAMGYFASDARAVNGAGDVVIGWTGNGMDQLPCVWNAGEPIQLLSLPQGASASANDLNVSGSTIVGTGIGPTSDSMPYGGTMALFPSLMTRQEPPPLRSTRPAMS